MFFFFRSTTETVGNKPASSCLCNSSVKSDLRENSSLIRHAIGFAVIAVLAVGSVLVLAFNNAHAGEFRLTSPRGIATSPATHVER